jgi:spore coat protein CotH
MGRLLGVWLLALVGALALCLASVFPGSPGGKTKADQTDELFNGGKVLRLTIELGPKELESLRKEPRKYVKCTLKEGDAVYQDVGIHLKGGIGSFRKIDDKPGLTLNMHKFKKRQRFHGLDKFHLANSVQDPSYLSELIGGELFRAAGVPASRIAHAVVTLNGKRRGLYYLKEGYDSQFRKRHFKNHRGNFYDGGYLQDLNAPLQLLSGKEDVKDRADLKAVFAAAQEKDPKVRFQKLEKLLDMDKFISYLALEVITFDWDGYPFMRNNYRVYHDPKEDKIIFIPSGMDQILRPNAPPLLVPAPPWPFQGVVARKLFETPQGRERFLVRVKELMKDIYRPAALCKRVDELAARLQPVLTSIDPVAGKQYPKEVEQLRFGIRLRAKQIEEQLKQLKK